MSTLPTLFLVEDDNLFAMLLKRLIKKVGHVNHLGTFGNGLDILNYIKDNAADTEKLPDIILLDLNMPIMDGWQFLDEFNHIHESLPKSIKIYILSSSIFTADVEKSKQYKTVTDYLIKPLSEKKLQEIVMTYGG